MMMMKIIKKLFSKREYVDWSDYKRKADFIELFSFQQQTREESIKNELEFARKKRDFDINHNHNPLDTKNVTKTEWEILKEKSQFSGRSTMLDGTESIMKNTDRFKFYQNLKQKVI